MCVLSTTLEESFDREYNVPNTSSDLYLGNTAYREVHYQSQNTPDGGIIDVETSYKHVPSKEIRKYVFRQGVSTPGYETKRKAGNLPVNPFTYRNTIVSFPTYQGAGYRVLRNYSYLSGSFDGTVPPNHPDSQYLYRGYFDASLLSSAVSEAKSRVLADIKSQKINLAQFWAERKQTISLIADSAMKVAGFINNLRKGDIISAGKALGSRPSRRIRRNFREMRPQSARDATADAWLAMQYGWKPLLSDVYGAVDTLVERVSDIQRHMAKSKAVRSEEYELHNIPSACPGMSWNVVVKSKITVKYTFMFDVTQAALNQQMRLGLTNPLQLAWELVPYSFVVDWFIPVGNALSNLDATMGVSFSTGAKVVRIESTTTMSLVPNPNSKPPDVAWGSGTATSKIVSIDRSVETSFPTPQLPELKNPLSVTHALNALALLSGAVSRRRSS